MYLKTRLHRHLVETIYKRKCRLEEQLNEMHIESKQNNKGSAGDKHEVGIEMAHIELEKLQSQISLLDQQLSLLQNLTPDHQNTALRLGALFKIDNTWYYCSVAHGQILFEKIQYYCLSPEAPLFKALKGKKVNQTVHFNGREWRITQIL